MRVTCPECDQDVLYHELGTDTRLVGGEFATTYRCPYCGARLPDVESE